MSPGCGAIWQRLDCYSDLLAIRSTNPARYPYLLESVAHGPPQARYDVLLAFPGERLVLDGRRLLRRDDQPIEGEFLAALDAHWRQLRCARLDTAPVPFLGGWFLFLSYEFARWLEPERLRAMPPPLAHLPVALAVRCPAAIIRDHEHRCIWVVCEEEQQELLPALLHDALSASAVDVPQTQLPTLASSQEEDPELYRQRISRVLRYIRAGETYQVNLSRQWSAQFDQSVDPAAVYRHLRRTNPSPFAGLAQIDAGLAIVSSSPERLVAVSGRRINTRPIAGTFPRADTMILDAAQSQSLVRDPKERAEHVMLVDLERNDLGRVCRPGTVRAGELLTVETYRHVHHIVSDVSGELRADVTPGDIIRAVFPGGTITGCPKLRTMQIIAELEEAPRGAYTGSMGYLNRDGDLDLNILIRTMTQRGEVVSWRAGGGIVADSDPERELDETRNKARGLLNAFALDAKC